MLTPILYTYYLRVISKIAQGFNSTRPMQQQWLGVFVLMESISLFTYVSGREFTMDSTSHREGHYKGMSVGTLSGNALLRPSLTYLISLSFPHTPMCGALDGLKCQVMLEYRCWTNGLMFFIEIFCSSESVSHESLYHCLSTIIAVDLFDLQNTEILGNLRLLIKK